MDSSKLDTKINLLNKLPNQLIYKIASLAENEKINKGNIEVVVLFGNNMKEFSDSVNKIGATLEDLGYGFGIVTIKASDIRRVSELQGAQYIELPKVLFTSDFNSNKASCVIDAWNQYGLSGQGVLVGFIDTGIDYTHPAFNDEAGNTRIEFIYDLGEDRKVYTKAQIDEALKASDPLSIVNVTDPLEHGTHVAGIACAGGKLPRQNWGVAYKSSIAMVKTTRGGNLNYALSTQIMRGIKFLIDKSNELNRPLVINISLSSNDGAHNGTSLLEQYIETICRLERVAMVIAAGNEGDAAHHVGGELSEVNNITLSVSALEPALTLQLYKPLLTELSIEIANPLGQRTGQITLNEGYKELTIGADRCIIYNTGPKPFDINGEITISFLPGAEALPGGDWTIILRVLNNSLGLFDMWLPITEAINTSTKFLNPDVYNTLGIPATVQSAISVGSYNYLTNAFSSFSGRGKRFRISFDKPDIVAPGEGIRSTVPGGNFDIKSGTSMASPNVAGICALLLEWGIVQGKDPFLYGDRIKYYLSKGAKRERTEISYPDPSWGYGTDCLYNSLELLKSANVRNININDKNELIDEIRQNINVNTPQNIVQVPPQNQAPKVQQNIPQAQVPQIGQGAPQNQVPKVQQNIPQVQMPQVGQQLPPKTQIPNAQQNVQQNISPKQVQNTLPQVNLNLSDFDLNYVQYTGDIAGAISKIPDARVAVIDSFRAILVSFGRSVNDIMDELGEIIVYRSPGGMFTLNEISPSEAAGVGRFSSNEFLSLNGQGVIVGIIDTGIDYLNQEFMNEDGSTRIISIFDQSNSSGRKVENQPVGSEFTREQINRAINEKRAGRDPYAIVPTRDEVGHGTNMAGIIGARGISTQIDVIAPKCDFAIVKLINISERIRRRFCVYGSEPTYHTASIILAMNYLVRLSSSLERPIVIYIPLGSNMTGHNGLAPVERYIDEVSRIRGVIVVASTGNEGEGDTHTYGLIANKGDTSSIELNIDPKQKDIRFDIWIPKPDIYSLSIISPSGEIVDRIPPKLNESTQINFIYEQTKMFVQYFIPEVISGDQLITIVARNIREGIWIFRLTGEKVSIGKYDSWLPQRKIIAPETRFIRPNPYMTLTSPSTSREVISVAFYNQNFDSIEEKSGRGYPTNAEIKPDLAAGGINAITTAVGGGIETVSGASVAGAVVAGCVALLLQWGILKGNDPEMYSTKIRTYLTRGTSKREGDTYPNQEWGYGTINMKNVFDNIRGLEDLGTRESNVPQKINYLTLPGNRNFIIEYQGNIVNSLKKYPNTGIYLIDDKRAIISVPAGKIEEITRGIPEIIYVDTGGMYTLSDVSPAEASQATFFYNNIYLPLDGSGVIAGIIDTGIDYLNSEFINEDGTSKILAIWDQTIESNAQSSNVALGTEYKNEDINKAIQTRNSGGDPYSVVPSKDIIGHGTSMAGIISARGVDPNLRGIAPNSNLLVVKLREATKAVRDDFGVYGNVVGFRSTTIFLALRYMYEYSYKINKPIVIFLPLGSNNGAHNGQSTIERYIDDISSFSGITVVVPTGNQGNSNTHTSGIIKKTGDVGIIELRVGISQKDINLEIWISKPDKVAISITSPSGEVIRRIPPKLNEVLQVNFVFEETKMNIEYLIPEEVTGEEKIIITANNMKEGIWRFRLIGDLILVGKYDAWILPKEFLAPDTRFLSPDPNITLTIPSTASSAIGVAFYNQNNNSIVVDSGRGFTRSGEIQPCIAAGGINQITTAVGGGSKVVSGSSVAGAVVAGCCALLFEWGIVHGNDPTMYSSKVKTYLVRGTNKREGDIYPNPEWGYGIVNLKGVFDNIRGIFETRNREAPPPKKINYFIQEGNENRIAEYKGDIVSAISKYPGTGVFVLDFKRAVISMPYNKSEEIIRNIPEIIYADVGSIYTLCDISAIDASTAPSFHNSPYLQLDGSGVIVGIISSGIDYLNEEFINEDGTSRILNLWDQTIQSDVPNPNLIAGTEYTGEEINKAIQAKKNGQDPYAIVPSKDIIGHGTNMAGIIAAKGVNPELVGVAPASSLAIVKLNPITKAGREEFGVYGDVVAYRTSALFPAIRYLYQLSSRLKKPIVIYAPLCTNIGAHNGESITERYIDEISRYNGVVVVTPTGNQGNSSTHTSGIIQNTGDTSLIELRVGTNQKSIRFEIWISRPDKVSLSITSPTGEVIQRIVPKIKEKTEISFIYERTKMTVEYSIPEEITGDERITIFATNLKEGIWQFKLIGDLIVVGKYNSWLLQRELLAPETNFLNPKVNVTLTSPATSEEIISVGYYNQNNRSIVADSGKGYTTTNIIKPEIVAGGINQITTAVGGGTKSISGSCVAGAIIAGCSALILQWGIIEKNDPSMYASKVKTYLIRGTDKRPGDVYPNPNWGYGMVNLRKSFDNIRALENMAAIPVVAPVNMQEKKTFSKEIEYNIGNLFIRIPKIF
ncbi:S8 family serine peptidase [Clostridium sp. 'White wine YQ']|nr:S8 family serine peptidase [Clostridium sp. 'White wine YQ']MDD7794197.1 S8 family serine peptidase [Clostridium sp. 'White wine YQ']